IVTFHLGILLTGSPQDMHVLARWSHSPNCLPDLTHPGDSTCLLVNPKLFLCLTHFPTVGRLSALGELTSIVLSHAANH
uniref:Uncharacterized protein n=1 Tax=Piliocolobus tephrosceles TaxID=591936 RepID=A0A8C9IIT6_9PRIM